jgi:hypothetical protein
MRILFFFSSISTLLTVYNGSEPTDFVSENYTIFPFLLHAPISPSTACVKRGPGVRKGAAIQEGAMGLIVQRACAKTASERQPVKHSLQRAASGLFQVLIYSTDIRVLL